MAEGSPPITREEEPLTEEEKEWVEWQHDKTPEQIARRLHKMSVEAKLGGIDPLTGIFNRRGFINNIERLQAEALREGHVLLFVTLDLDDLKIVNDSGGHEEGDKYLKNAAQNLKESVRGSDLICRYGGDEYAALLLVNSDDDPKVIVDRMRKNFESTPASFGYAYLKPESSYNETFQKADSALYSDKKNRKAGR